MLTTQTPEDGHQHSFQYLSVPLLMEERLRRWWRRCKRKTTSDLEGFESKKVISKDDAIKKILSFHLENFLLTYGVGNSQRMPSLHDLWILPALCSVENKKWDLIISTHAPYCTLIVGWILKLKNPQSFFVVDFRDLWCKNHIYRGLPLFRFIEKRLEKAIIKCADMIVTVSQPLADRISRDFPQKKVYISPNGVDVDKINSLKRDLIFPDSSQIRFVYTGSIYPGLQDISPVLLFLKSLSVDFPDLYDMSSLVLAGSNLQSVVHLADSLGVSRKLQVSPLCPHEDALRMQRDADFLIFLGASSREKGIVTGKLYEYLSSGTPIVAVDCLGDESVQELLGLSGSVFHLPLSRDSLIAEMRRISELRNRPLREFDLEIADRLSRSRKARLLLDVISESMFA